MILFQLFVVMKLFFKIPMIFHGILLLANILLIFYIISKDEPAEYKLPWIFFLIAIPGDTDAWYIAVITKSYYKKLLRLGVKIYEYTPGFLHQKTFLSDKEVGVAGTISPES